MVWEVLLWYMVQVLLCVWVRGQEVLHYFHYNYNYKHFQKNNNKNKEKEKKMKKPVHLAIILDQLFNSKKVARLLKWCISSGIRTISIFQFEALLLQEHNELLQHLHTHVPVELITPQKREQFHWQNKKKQKEQEEKEKIVVEGREGEGEEEEEKEEEREMGVKVHLLSVKEGRWDVVSVTQNLCRSVEKKGEEEGEEEEECCWEELSAEDVQHNLCTHSLPDPELVLHFGGVACSSLNGFLPWQIRLTEICQMPPLQYTTKHSFQSALHHYARSEQRFGT